MQTNLAIPQAAIADFCRRHHIRRLAFFGSVLREDFGPDSDVDVLVEFDPEHVPGLALIRLQDELSELLSGRPVDMITFKSIHPYIRDHVLSDMELQYAEG